MIAPSEKHDLAVERGLSAETLSMFNLRCNGTGWLYDTKCMDGSIATRRKSFWSTAEQAPEDERPNWKKYSWYPEKKATARYFYPPAKSLLKAVDDAWGTLWIVGGDIAHMSLIEAGILNSISCFGDHLPDEFMDDLKSWKITSIRLIPDRDTSSEKWAITIRDRIINSLEAISLHIHALPYELLPKHGKDVNDYWRELGCNKAEFIDKLLALPEWILPQPIVLSHDLPDTSNISNSELPTDFIRDIERSLGIQSSFRHDGWSMKNVRCPFHQDDHESANWNHEKAILKCFAASCSPPNGRGYWLASEVGVHYGLDLKSYANVPYATKSSPVPKSDPVTIEKMPPLELVKLRPALPPEAELMIEQRKMAKEGRKWLDECVHWATASCPLAPEIFHEAMALWLLATVSTRRMKLSVGGEDIYPNLYIMIVGKTTLFHKSTALNRFRKLIKAARLEPLLLPIDVTPEALFDELAGVKPINFDALPQDEQHNWLLGRAVAAQRSIIKDEASSILANLKKDYNAGLSELLLQGYDGDTGTLRKLLKSRGIIVVKDMCLSFLGATTPVMYSKYIGNEETENGFIARFAIITPEGIPEHRYSDDDVQIPDKVLFALRRMFTDILPWHNGQKPSAPAMLGDVVSPPVMSLQIDPLALKQLNIYRKALGYDMLLSDKVDENKAANYARLGTMAFKIAMLLAAIETESGQIIIKPCHAYAAQMICERWRESLHRLDRDIAHSGNTIEDKVLSYLKSAGIEGVTIRELIRDCAIKGGKSVVVGILNTLADENLVESYDKKPEGAGRPTKKFRYAKFES
jgi:hypothetical protein